MSNKEVVYRSMSRSEKIWDYVTRALVPISIALAGFVVQLERRTASLELRIDEIEKTRFTKYDGLALQASILNEIRTSYPPEWLRKSIARLELQADRTDDKLDVINDRLTKMEARK